MKDREIVKVDSRTMRLLMDAVDLDYRKMRCYSCGMKVNIDPLDFGLFNKPDRVVHNNPFCMAIFLEDEEDSKVNECCRREHSIILNMISNQRKKYQNNCNYFKMRKKQGKLGKNKQELYTKTQGKITALDCLREALERYIKK